MASSKQLGVMGILVEALKIFLANTRLMAPITLIAISNSLTFYGTQRTHIFSFNTDLFSNSSLPQIKDPIHLLIKAITHIHPLSFFLLTFHLISFCSISVFCIVASIHATAAALTGKSPISYQELNLISGRKWCRTMITWLFATFLTTITCGLIIVLLLALEGLVFGVVLAVLLCLVVLYLDVVSMLALVITVVEEDHCGLESLVRAHEVVLRGKLRLKEGLAAGIVLNLFISLPLSAPLIGFLLADPKLALEVRLILGLVVINLNWLVSAVFGTVAHTVFYFHCCKNEEQEQTHALLGASQVVDP